jgi:hypothetical protein
MLFVATKPVTPSPMIVTLRRGRVSPENKYVRTVCAQARQLDQQAMPAGFVRGPVPGQRADRRDPDDALAGEVMRHDLG